MLLGQIMNNSNTAMTMSMTPLPPDMEHMISLKISYLMKQQNYYNAESKKIII